MLFLHKVDQVTTYCNSVGFEPRITFAFVLIGESSDSV